MTHESDNKDYNTRGEDTGGLGGRPPQKNWGGGRPMHWSPQYLEK